MRLKSLYVKQFKNLVNFKVDFSSGEGLTFIIGNNGSGKSNVLEAVSGIFANAYSAKRQHRFEYVLIYEISGHEVRLEQTSYRCQYYVDGCVKSIKNLSAQGLLPSNVIAMYSGEDKRWWHCYFEPFYSKFIRSINTGMGTVTAQKMYYLNKYYWDIALLTLIYSNASDDITFLKNIIGIENIDYILLFYSNFVTRSCKNELLRAFLGKINMLSKNSDAPNGDPVFLYAMQAKDIEKIYGIGVNPDALALKDFYMFVDATFLKERPDNFEFYEKELFDFFVQAYMPKGKKVIKDIEMVCNGHSAKNFSEGEKKLILLRSILSYVADENSLVLFDEPDANIHEERKQDLYTLFSEYCRYGRQMVIATHSPILANLAKGTELLMIESEGGKSEVFTEEKIDKIKKLLGNSFDIIGQTMKLKSNKPLVIFEGKTDVVYVKRALELLRKTDPKYYSLDIDFLNANGAGNVRSFVDNLKELVPQSKRIIVFFDRDDAGREGAHAVTNISKDDERIVHYQDIIADDFITSFIPYKEGIEDGDFLIEDYFSWDTTISAIIEDIMPLKKHPIKVLPNLPKRIKKEIEDRVYTLGADDFSGFSVLLDKILSLSQEEAI